MGQAPNHRVPHHPLLAAAVTPIIGIGHPASDDRPPWLEALTDRDQPKLIKAAESGQVRGSEGSVKHVEVFLMGGVRTSIF